MGQEWGWMRGMLTSRKALARDRHLAFRGLPAETRRDSLGRRYSPLRPPTRGKRHLATTSTPIPRATNVPAGEPRKNAALAHTGRVDRRLHIAMCNARLARLQGKEKPTEMPIRPHIAGGACRENGLSGHPRTAVPGSGGITNSVIIVVFGTESPGLAQP
jgi:hypothetical protein